MAVPPFYTSPMCGRATHKFTWKEIYELLEQGIFPVRLEAELAASYNMAPTQSAPIVRQTDGHLEGLLAQWGLRPAWATEKLAPINARAETVETSPMFRAAFRARRCLVPVSGFYEWQVLDKKTKQPWYIYRADGKPLLFAGLWEMHSARENFTIITTRANPFMGLVHDRMPVVLEPEQAHAWLRSSDPALLRPAADGVLAAHKVSTRVNSPKNNEPSLIEAV
jgi:putative SOS response-associated peptidase YedK